MNIDHFFFRLYAVSKGGAMKFLGSAFPVTPSGSLLTCRHVAEAAEIGELAVHHNLTGWKIHVAEVRTSGQKNLDLAYLPNSLGKAPTSFIPILPPRAVLVGTPIYSYGFFKPAGADQEVEQGFFSGRVVNLLKVPDSDQFWTLTLPYPIIEGMSGSAVITDVNGPKLAGLAYGNQSSRILASEVLEYEDEKMKVREEIHRIVEFGRAYHCDTVLRFLKEVGASNFSVTAEHVDMPGLVLPPGAV